jgi:hypothetical protein
VVAAGVEKQAVTTSCNSLFIVVIQEWVVAVAAFF